MKCWFRIGDAGRETSKGWVAGSRSCVPPDTKSLTMGNTACFDSHVGYSDCCDFDKYGSTGNEDCWDKTYNYDLCCFPKLTLVRPETTSSWPGCQEYNIVVRNADQALFVNLQAYGATSGCYLDDCTTTDKFATNNVDTCATVCFSLPECQFWVWGLESGVQKCWLRIGDAGRETGKGWVSGGRSCVPPDTKALTMGNAACWDSSVGYGDCCDFDRYGPTGNDLCWDATYNFDRCCIPRSKL